MTLENNKNDENTYYQLHQHQHRLSIFTATVDDTKTRTHLLCAVCAHNWWLRAQHARGRTPLRGSACRAGVQHGYLKKVDK